MKSIIVLKKLLKFDNKMLKPEIRPALRSGITWRNKKELI